MGYASVSFRGKKLIPAPLIGIKRIYQRSADGTARQHSYAISINAQLVLWKGSPDEDGNFWDQSDYPPDTNANDATEPDILDIFKKKMGAIQNLFDTDGLLLIQPGNGGAPIKIQLTVNSINFPEGKWTRTLPYLIEGEAQSIIWGTETDADSGSQSQLSNPPEESWNLEQTDESGRIFKLVHSLSSQAKKRFDDDGNVTAEGYEVAKDLIIGGPLAGTGAVNKLGFTSSFLVSSDVLNLDNFQPYNYTRTEQTDKTNGRVAITETWTCIDPTVSSPTGQTAGKAIEELNVDTKFSLDDGLYTVAMTGTVIGMEERNSTTRAMIKDRWTNANERFDTITTSVIHSLAEELSETTLNPQPITTNVAKNRVTGVIQWAQVFNNRMGNSDAAYLSEIIEVEFNNAADVFAEIGVIARPAGPVLQTIGSTTRKSMNINIAIIVATSYGNTPTMPTTNPLAIFLSYIGVPNQLYLASDIPRWNPKQGRYSRSTTYVYQ